MQQGFFLIRWCDFSKPNAKAKTSKTILDLDTAINFFSQPFTGDLVQEIVQKLNADWNKSYANKTVIFEKVIIFLQQYQVPKNQKS